MRKNGVSLMWLLIFFFVSFYFEDVVRSVRGKTTDLSDNKNTFVSRMKVYSLAFIILTVDSSLYI